MFLLFTPVWIKILERAMIGTAETLLNTKYVQQLNYIIGIKLRQRRQPSKWVL